MTIQRFPAGFLGLLEAQTQGQTPAQVARELSAIVDAGPHYLSTIGLKCARNTQTLPAGGAVGPFARINIPASEVWQVVAVSSLITFGATGQNCWLSPQLDDVPFSEAGDATAPVDFTLIGDVLNNTGYSAGTIGDTRKVTWTAPYPLVMKAPVRFQTNVARNGTNGTSEIQTFVLYYQLD